MAPFFSIVLVNYNHGLFINDALTSIVTQDCLDYELIVVDGGSTDNSVEIISRFSSHITWWVSERDGGQSNAFNKGFLQAKGSFYFWLNADDILLPKTLSKAKHYLSSHKECKWLASNTLIIDVSRKVKWCIRGPHYIDILVRNGTVYIYGPSSFFKREIFVESGGFDEKLFYTMDTDLWYRFVNLGYKFERLNHYSWGLRIHSESKTSHAFTSKPTSNFFLEKIYIQKKNRHKILRVVELCQFLLKLISGCLLIKWFDDFRLKGKTV